MSTSRLLTAWVLVLLACPALAVDPRDARTERIKAAIDESTRTLATAPESQHKDLYLRRAALYSLSGRHDLAVADFDRVLGADPLAAAIYDERGSEQFMLGNIDKAIADFDRAIHLRPNLERGHWKRGIAYYYAGRYDDGRRQFESYQTVDHNDVENAVWKFLCQARSESVEAARRDMLKIERDARVPLMTIYKLFAGKAMPDDVLTDARAGSPSPEALNTRLFYAYLYLGLYEEALGHADQAQKLLALAREHKIDHYMWNVADVHLARLEQPPAKR